MSKPKRESDDDFDEIDLFLDEELDLDEFLDTMGERSEKGRRPRRAAWQRLEERNDVRRLREQLEDWDDWEITDSH